MNNFDDAYCPECGNNRIYGHKPYCSSYPGNREKFADQEIQIILCKQINWCFKTRNKANKKERKNE